MWKLIADIIAKNNQQPFEDAQHTMLSSGGENRLAYKFFNQHQAYFVKLAPKHKLDQLTAEVDCLAHLREINRELIPKVIGIDVTLDKSFLVLPWLDFTQPSDDNWYQLGIALAKLHKNSSNGQFGWDQDNFIGDTLQPNQWSSNWSTFFAEKRISWQLQLLSEKSVNFGDIDYLSQVCHDLLCHHKVSPSLVHGDLWHGNVGFVDGQPLMFDPACYFADREVDIAMTELFGSFPDAFYQGYQQTLPLDEGFEQRKHLYNLYHVLNHANMFGGIYIKQAQALLQRIIAQHENL
ncbi:fructosamine kinase family protein [Thalassotalea sp. LPB0316]|uniref:fructosamine kinase family protein n=1 Tax=Thalassotalea sp. LPB0316 TaxID=2769490 RepID=UPI001868889A|nr:fructosamine kinase family protein [Thalassotalea sp. LPB0316]QOL25068.1 fructosamine kinase family protein [Thalassotalea sp. LPB0316]